MTVMMQWQVNRQFKKDREVTIARIPNPDVVQVLHQLVNSFVVLIQIQLGMSCPTQGLLLYRTHVGILDRPCGQTKPSPTHTDCPSMWPGNEPKEDELLASSIRKKLPQQSSSLACSCIFRIPHILRRGNENVFVPNLVSIGPYHHGHEDLKAMEEIKQWYLHCLLERRGNQEASMMSFVKGIRSMEKYCRDCYGEKVNLSSDDFVEIMVVDGCFIIELFRKYNTDATAGMYLLLLENQIPWRVLDCLFKLTRENDEIEETSLSQLTLNYFEFYTLGRYPKKIEETGSKHLLDFIRSCLLGGTKEDSTNNHPSTDWAPIPSVTELLQAGVKFRRTDDSMLNITFENGVMKIPPIVVNENGESLFRNLIVYEQCEASVYECKITSYAVVLDNLITTSSDVDILMQKGILFTHLSKEDIASFFNKLYNNTIPGHFSYKELTDKVNEHYHGRFNRWKTILARDYFNNRWSTLAFAGALLGLGLTFMQTLYAILAYK
ncbi:unnamed protein product, partial [Prunus brigantina]